MVVLGVMSSKAIKKVTYFLTGFYCLLKEYRITKATKQGKEISLGILQKRKQKRERACNKLRRKRGQ